MAIDVADLKARNPITSVIGSYTKLTRAGNTYRGKCPVHGGEHDNLVVYPESNNGSQRHEFERYRLVGD